MPHSALHKDYHISSRRSDKTVQDLSRIQCMGFERSLSQPCRPKPTAVKSSLLNRYPKIIASANALSQSWGLSQNGYESDRSKPMHWMRLRSCTVLSDLPG